MIGLGLKRSNYTGWSLSHKPGFRYAAYNLFNIKFIYYREILLVIFNLIIYFKVRGGLYLLCYFALGLKVWE